MEGEYSGVHCTYKTIFIIVLWKKLCQKRLISSVSPVPKENQYFLWPEDFSCCIISETFIISCG